jgi:hypothetical protein
VSVALVPVFDVGEFKAENRSSRKACTALRAAATEFASELAEVVVAETLAPVDVLVEPVDVVAGVFGLLVDVLAGVIVDPVVVVALPALDEPVAPGVSPS